jgi:hydroxymethylpyrimidine/phosphomethylpyrimidine kinase
VAVLAIGGLDPTAGAGVAADVRTLEALGVAPAVAITAIAVQDGRRVRSVTAMPAALVRAQIEAAAAAFPIAAVKCGMLARPAIVAAVADLVAKRRWPLVLDPVLRASGGEALATPALVRALARRLIPLAAVVTPNLYEASVLAGMPVTDAGSMEAAARRILALGARAVVVKGGHLAGRPLDLLVDEHRVVRLLFSRVRGDMHGTGCAFAAALAACIARGMTPEQSLRVAHTHVRALLKGMLKLPRGARLRAPKS